MAASWDDLDAKVLEADFFLENLRGAGLNFLEARCYFSAFVSAARSITFAIQALLDSTPGFADWYRQWQEQLRADPRARFFVEIRNETQKIGRTPVNVGASQWRPDGPPLALYYFAGDERAPSEDVVTACTGYMTTLVELVMACYGRFGSPLERPSLFSVTRLLELGLSVEEVEEALGYPRGWTAVPGLDEEERLAALRRQAPDLLMDPVFKKYMGRTLEAHDGAA